MSIESSRDKLVDEFSSVLSEAESLLDKAAKETGDKARDLRSQVEARLLSAKLKLQELEGEAVDRANGVTTVNVKKFGVDESKFITEFDPSNPAADEKGIVKLPNVNMLVEMADMREANRSYDANLQTIKQSRDLISSTIDLLKSQ